jgi:hypothetical protein
VSVRDTTGVGGLARVFRRLADRTAGGVAEFAAAEGLSRSTAFDLARRLEAAGLVAREPSGKLVAGSRAMALAYARYGLARLHGPAEAVLRWLRDHGEVGVKLTCEGDGERLTLLAFNADGAKASEDHAATRIYAVRDERGDEAARLEVALRKCIAETERAEIERLSLRAKATLEHHLREWRVGCAAPSSRVPRRPPADPER